MLIYNITFHIDDSIHDEAVRFLTNSYIPQAKKNGVLFNPRFCRVHSNHDDHGKSYSVQFYVKNQDLLNEWWTITGKELHDEITKTFQDKLIGFTTILEELDIDCP